MSEPASLEEFQPFVGRIFTVETTGHALALDHIATDPHIVPRPGDRRPFILVFRGPKTPDYLREGLYACRIEDGPGLHPACGAGAHARSRLAGLPGQLQLGRRAGLPQARLGPLRPPLDVGAVARDHIEAARDHQQAIGPWMRQGADEGDGGQRRQHRTQGNDPEHRHDRHEHRRGGEAPRPGNRQQHAQPRRRRLAAREVQPDRPGVADQGRQSGQADHPGQGGLQCGRPRRLHRRPCVEPGHKPADEFDRRHAFQQVHHQHRQRGPPAQGAQHIGGSDGAGAVLPDVHAQEQPPPAR